MRTISNSVKDFYDQLAEDYHLIFEEWDKSVRRQALVLDRIIREYAYPSRSPIKLLDCTCGIGTQAIGLAMLGYNVHATDLSPSAIERAEREARRLGVQLTFDVADLRTINHQVKGLYNVIIACDNSLPHLLDDQDLQLSLNNTSNLLVVSGLFIASIRDYDQLTKERPVVSTPSVFEGATGKRVVFQVWDWDSDGRTYNLHHFILKQDGESWHTSHLLVKYRALLRGELSEAMEAAGFSRIEWHMPEETGYYQPIVTSHKS